MSVSGRLKGAELAPTITFASRIDLARIKRDLAASGKQVFDLMAADVGRWGHQNKFLTELLIEAERSGYGGSYASVVSGTQFIDVLGQFKESAADFQRSRKVECTPEDIIPVAGLGNAFSLIHFCLLDPGSEMLAVGPAHYFWAPSSYLSLYQSKAKSSMSDESNDWQPDLDDLRSKVSGRTKAIVIENPSNPTGNIYSDRSLKGILDIAGEHNLPVISDEIYDMVLYDGNKAPSPASVSRDVPVISMYSTSKFFMKPGWRLGYICFHDPEGKIAEFRKYVQMVAGSYGHSISCIPTSILAAGAKAFRGPFDEGNRMMEKLQRSRDYTFKRLNEIQGLTCTKPKGSLFAFPRVNATGKKWKTDEEFVAELMKEEGVLFAPGWFFGDTGRVYFRALLLPSLETLREVYDRLERFMKKCA